MIRLKRSKRVDTPVSVNERLAKLSHDEMLLYVETSIMNAGYAFSQYRSTRGQEALSEAIQQLAWGLEGAGELRRRDGLSV